MENKILNLDDYRPSEDEDDYGYTPAMGITREEWIALYESTPDPDVQIDFPSMLDTPKPESYDSIEQYKLIKALEEADGNASGLERAKNLEEARKYMLGQEADLERAVAGFAFQKVMSERAAQRFSKENPEK